MPQLGLQATAVTPHQMLTLHPCIVFVSLINEQMISPSLMSTRPELQMTRKVQLECPRPN